MKNFFKKIQFGALAVLFGLTLVFTQSAFKSTIPGTYGQLNGTGQWVDVNNPPAGTEYICEGDTELCHAQYSDNPGTNPSATKVPGSDEFGILRAINVD